MAKLTSAVQELYRDVGESDEKWQYYLVHREMTKKSFRPPGRTDTPDTLDNRIIF